MSRKNINHNEKHNVHVKKMDIMYCHCLYFSYIQLLSGKNIYHNEKHKKMDIMFLSLSLLSGKNINHNEKHNVVNGYNVLS